MEGKQEIWYQGTFEAPLGFPISYTDKITSELPIYQGYTPREPPFNKVNQFKVCSVKHNTHSDSKDAICSKDGKLAYFKANWKSTSPLFSYTIVKPNEKIKNGLLYPSKYVWFAMGLTLPEDIEKDKYSECPWLNGCSIYGPWSFTFKYEDLLKQYKKHLENHTNVSLRTAEVLLRNGGTFVYQREVSYVVMITHTMDTTHSDECYPQLQIPYYQSPNDWQGQRGLIIYQLEDVYFKPKYVPTKTIGYDWKSLQRYDQVVFAVHCDWIGNIAASLETPHQDQLSSDSFFTMDLPMGQPKNEFHFFDTIDAYESSIDCERYEKYHFRCLHYKNNIKLCYWTERRAHYRWKARFLRKKAAELEEANQLEQHRGMSLEREKMQESLLIRMEASILDLKAEQLKDKVAQLEVESMEKMANLLFLKTNEYVPMDSNQESESDEGEADGEKEASNSDPKSLEQDTREKIKAKHLEEARELQCTVQRRKAILLRHNALVLAKEVESLRCESQSLRRKATLLRLAAEEKDQDVKVHQFIAKKPRYVEQYDERLKKEAEELESRAKKQEERLKKLNQDVENQTIRAFDLERKAETEILSNERSGNMEEEDEN